jgi:hypothetical protein
MWQEQKRPGDWRPSAAPRWHDYTVIFHVVSEYSLDGIAPMTEIIQESGQASGSVVVTLEHRWNKAVESAHQKYGIKKLSLYKIRHSWASQRRTQGYSLDQVGAVLGHSDLRTTKEHYADVGMGQLISIVRGK